MKGHKQIIEIRQQGLKPASIFIEAGLTQILSGLPVDDPENGIQHGHYPSVVLTEDEIGAHHDLRFVTGCRVHLQAKTISDDVLGLAERLVEAGAAHVIVIGLDTTDLMEYKNGEWKAWQS